MPTWKRLNGRRIKPGEKGYNNATWQVSGQFKGVCYKESVPLAKTKQDADDREQQIKSAIVQGEYDLQKRKRTFRDYVEKTYLPRVKIENVSWRRNKKFQIERLIGFFGNYQLKLINRTLCERFRDKRRAEKKVCQRCKRYKETCYLCAGEKPRYSPPCWKCRKRMQLFSIHKMACQSETVKPSTVNRDLVTLSDILSDAVIDGEIKDNPMRFVKKLKENAPSERILTEVEKQRLFAMLRQSSGHIFYRMKAIVLIALMTGWREGRIMAIKKEDLNEATKTVRVIGSKQSQAKTVRVTDAVFAILKEFADEVADGLIWRNAKTGEPLKSFPRDVWNKILRGAGIKRLRFHDLRATVAVEMLLDGANTREVQKTLDHKRITTTEIYLRLTEQMQKPARDKQSERYKEFVK